MTRRLTILAATLVLSCAAPLTAAPVSVVFQFGNGIPARGTVFGLDDALGVQSASYVAFDGRVEDDWVIDAAEASENTFTFENGLLSSFVFGFSVPPAVTGFNFLEGLQVSETSGFSAEWDADAAETVIKQGPVQTRVAAISAVPLPAGGILFLGALAALGAVRRAKG